LKPEEEVIERAREDEREGKSPSTQAGEFVREAMEHIREGEHGARSAKQAIAIGLSKARRAGVKLPPPKRRKTSSRAQPSERWKRAGPSGRFPSRFVSSDMTRGTDAVCVVAVSRVKKAARTRKQRRR